MKTAYPENENSVSGGTKFIDTDPRDLSEYLSETNLEITKQRPGKNQTGKNQTASRQNPNPETESLKKTKRPQRYPNSLLKILPHLSRHDKCGNIYVVDSCMTITTIVMP